MEDVLAVNELSVAYRTAHKRIYAVNSASFSIQKGDSLGIVGESGSGKSTLAMAILRLLPASIVEISGKIDFLGKDLLALDASAMRELRWNHLAVVFQKAMNSLSPVHRIGEQIEDIYRVHRPNAGRKEIQERVHYLFGLVNLGERVLRLYPHELSGGMLQRISIAISLLHDPSLLILDEATTALDVVTQGQILEEIRRMEKELNLTRIMITHDMSVVASSCSKIAVMYAGEFVEMGAVRDVLPNPRHPYTAGLIASFPSLRGEKSELRSIEGVLPDLSQTYDYCIFAPRCPKAHARCLAEKPAMVSSGPGDWVKCNLYQGS
jgi:peptide/nickel transport system ATP-binding protein